MIRKRGLVPLKVPEAVIFLSVVTSPRVDKSQGRGVERSQLPVKSFHASEPAIWPYLTVLSILAGSWSDFRVSKKTTWKAPLMSTFGGDSCLVANGERPWPHRTERPFDISRPRVRALPEHPEGQHYYFRAS